MTLPIFFLILAAAFINALWNFALRSTRGDLAVLWLSYVVGAIACLPVIVWRVAGGAALPPRALAVMAISGCVHTVYMWGLAKAYRHGEISLVYPIARGTGVVGTAIAAVLLLGQSMSVLGAAGMFAVIAGIAMLSVSQLHIRGALASSAAAALVGCTTITYSIIDTWGAGQIDPLIYVFGPFVVPAVLVFPYVMRHWRPQVAPALATKKGVIVLTGVGGLVAYMVVLWAFRRTGQTGYVMAVRESSVVWGSLLGVLVLGESFGKRKLAGLAAIVSGLILVKLAS